MKTALLMSVVTGLILAIGYVLSLLFGVNSLYIVLPVFCVTMVLNLLCYLYSDRVVLRMYSAHIVSENIAPELYSKISRLSMKAGLPVPKIAVITSETPNAFATGRTPENAVVAVTSGALSLLQRDELEAVLAHELGHIKNGDMFISTVVAFMTGIAGSAGMLLASILVPLTVSRNREYAADKAGAEISGKPHALADALIRIEESVKQHPMEQGSPATAHLFIVNPFNLERLHRLLYQPISAHPSTESRVERLRKMAQSLPLTG